MVIPPMQICPGDLLVYGKVLSQRKSLLGEENSMIAFISPKEEKARRKRGREGRRM